MYFRTWLAGHALTEPSLESKRSATTRRNISNGASPIADSPGGRTRSRLAHMSDWGCRRRGGVRYRHWGACTREKAQRSKGSEARADEAHGVVSRVTSHSCSTSRRIIRAKAFLHLPTRVGEERVQVKHHAVKKPCSQDHQEQNRNLSKSIWGDNAPRPKEKEDGMD